MISNYDLVAALTKYDSRKPVFVRMANTDRHYFQLVDVTQVTVAGLEALEIVFDYEALHSLPSDRVVEP